MTRWKKQIQLMDRQDLDKEIKNIAQGEHIPSPENFLERIRRFYTNLPEGIHFVFHSRPGNYLTTDKKHWRRRNIPYGRYGVVLVGIICLLLAVTPVSANLQGHWRRITNMTGTEKREQLAGLKGSTANTDRFSRPLTASERQRMGELTISYEMDGTYPTGKITYIDSPTEISKDEFYFRAENSSFYLPDNELTDEQLLQIIDLSHKRKCSLAKSNRPALSTDDAGYAGARSKQQNQGRKLFQRDAVTLGEKWINALYDENVSNWKATVKQKDNPKDGSDIYAISYKDPRIASEYSLMLRAETGELLKMSCPYNGKRQNISRGLSVRNHRNIRKQYREVKEKLKQAGYSKEIVSCYCEYVSDQQTNLLAYGVISFLIGYADGTGLKIHYSYNSKEYYIISFIDDMTAHLKQETKNHAKHSAKKLIRTRLE